MDLLSLGSASSFTSFTSSGWAGKLVEEFCRAVAWSDWHFGEITGEVPGIVEWRSERK